MIPLLFLASLATFLEKRYAQYLVYICLQQLDNSQLVGTHNPWYLLQYYINCIIPSLWTESCGQWYCYHCGMNCQLDIRYSVYRALSTLLVMMYSTTRER
jgi:hypothetical protein